MPRPTKDRVLEVLTYKPEEGAFYWRKTYNNVNLGKRAGGVGNQGFLTLKIDGKNWMQHHLVYLIETGGWPEGKLFHHINGDKTDNRLGNLLVVDTEAGEFPSVDLLLTLYTYDKKHGKLYRKLAVSSEPEGKEAGFTTSNGYRSVSVMGTTYPMHHLIWRIETGEEVKEGKVIDHINGDKQDNRIQNLREVTLEGNAQNMKQATKRSQSGLLGVTTTKYKGNESYRAVIQTGGRRKHLGYFPTPEQAHEAYVQAKRVLHPTCTI